MNIKELAEQANKRLEPNWPGGVIWYWEDLERFAELVAAHTLMNIDPSKFIGGYQEGFEAGVAKESEECAKLCHRFSDRMMSAEECAGAIEARSKA
jgi:hypothetical protein